MNNVFRLIWNRTLGRLVVTSEAARSRDKAATRQGVVGQLPAPEVAGVNVPVLLRPMVVAVALAVGSLVLVVPEAVAYKEAGAIDTASCDDGNAIIGIGRDARACEFGAIAIGPDTWATRSAVALGNNARAFEGQSIAIGTDSTARNHGIALGREASASTGYAVAIGRGAAAQEHAVALGRNASARTDGVALGRAANAVSDSVAIGRGSVANGSGGVAVGQGSDAGAVNIRLINEPLPTDDLQRGLALGMGASGIGSVALGHDAKAGMRETSDAGAWVGTAIGAGAQSLAHRAIAIGTARNRVTSATGTNAIAMGNAVRAGGASSIAIGGSGMPSDNGTWTNSTRHRANGDRAVALGFSSQADGDNSVTLGTQARATEFAAMSLGRNSAASGRFSVALGNASEANGDSSLAVGGNTAADGERAIALGSFATASGERTIALGNSAEATATRATALGRNASATEADSVALGSGSVADTVAGVDGYIPLTASAAQRNAILNTAATRSAVDVGSRQITSVAAGTQDDDAVNVSQLKAVQIAAAEGGVNYYSVNDGGVPQGNFNNDGAIGTNALAAGANAIAEGNRSVAVGDGAAADGIFTSAIALVGASNPNGYEVGDDLPTTALGAGSAARSGTAVGHDAVAGKDAGDTVNTGTAIGAGAQATGNVSIAISPAAYAPAIADGLGAIAMGFDARANDPQALALGIRAEAGEDSVAVGYGTQASGLRSLAAGRRTEASAEDTIAFGTDAEASATNAIAIGKDSLASGVDTGAIGRGAVATGSWAVGTGANASNGGQAFGEFSTASGADSSAYGHTATATGAGASALGTLALADGAGATAVGEEAHADGERATAVGFNSYAFSNQSFGSIALGDEARAEAFQTVALGSRAFARGNQSMAIGNDVSADGYGSIGIGGDDLVSPETSVFDDYIVSRGLYFQGDKGSYDPFIGELLPGRTDPEDGGANLSTGYLRTQTLGVGSTAIGTSSIAYDTGATAIGAVAFARGEFSTALGSMSDAEGNASLALGKQSYAQGDRSIAMGSESLASVDDAIAVGTTARATGEDALAIGRDAWAAGSQAMGAGARAANGGAAFGDGAQATWREDNDSNENPETFDVSGAALGKNALANRSGATALGANTEVLVDDGVALGSGSISTVGPGVDGYIPATADAAQEQAILDTAAVRGAVDVGSRQITSVAAGTQDDDAVNVSQLKAVETMVADSGVNYYSVNDNGVQQGNYDNDGATGRNSLAAGTNAVASKDYAVAVGDGAEAIGFEAIAIGREAVASGRDSSIALGQLSEASGNFAIAIGRGAAAEEDNSVALGNGAISMVEQGVALGSGSLASVGSGVAGYIPEGTDAADEQAILDTIATRGSVDVGSRQITSVAAGTADGDAVNVSQLKSVSNVANKGWYLSANGEDTDGFNIAPGEAADFVEGQNITITREDGSITVATADDVEFTNVEITNQLDVAGDTNIGGNTTIEGDTTVKGDTYLGDNFSVVNNEAFYDGPITENTHIVNKEYVDNGLNNPLTFMGDSGTEFDRKLGETTNVVGGAEGGLTEGNIGVVADGEDTLTIQLAENIDLGEDGSVKMGDTTVNNDGLTVGDTIVNGDSITTNNLTVSGETRLGDSFVVNNDGNVTYEGDIVDGNNIVNKDYVDGQKTHYYSVNDNGTIQGNYENDGAEGINSLAAGTNALAQGDSSVAMGDGAETGALGDSQVAIGDGAFAGGNQSIAMGEGAQSGLMGQRSVAIGQGAVAQRTDAVSLGAGAETTTNDSVAIGKNASSTHAGSVALGSGSVANGSTLGSDAYSPTGDQNDVAGINPSSEISVGSAGNERRITNVAAGAEDTDAVNVSQLKLVDEVASKGWFLSANGEDLDGFNVAPGEAADFQQGQNIVITREDGSISVATADDVEFTNVDITENLTVEGDTFLGDSFSVVNNEAFYSGPITENTHIVNKEYVDNGLNNPLTFMGDSGTEFDRKLGETTNVVGGAEGGLTEGNIGVVADGEDTLTIQLAENIDLGEDGSVKMGDTTVNNDGLTIVGGPSVTNTGIDAGGQTITNVAPGIDGTDAVNVDQLTDVSDVANKGWYLSANGEDTDGFNIAPGEAADFVEGQNITITREDGSITVATADDVEFSNVEITENLTVEGDTFLNENLTVAGDTTINENLTVEGDTFLGDNFSIVNNEAFYDGPITENTHIVNKEYVDNGLNNPLTFMGDSGTEFDRKLGETTNVVGGAEGGLTEGNIGVVADGEDTLTIQLAENIDLGEDGSVKMGDTTVNNDGLTIVGGPSVTNTGIDAGGQTITNVAPGIDGTDAVNVDQLTEVNEVANKGWYLSANGEDTDGFNIAPGEAADFVEGQNITITREDGSITVATADDVEFSNVEITENLTVEGDTFLNENLTVAGDTTINENLTVEGDTFLGDNFSIVNNEAFYDGPITENTHIVNKEYVDNGLNNPLTFMGDSGTEFDRKLGETTNVVGGAEGGLTEGNIGVVADGEDTLTIQLAENIDLGEDGSVKMGDTTVNNDGLTIVGGPSVTNTGIDAGGQTITNVAPGIDGTDAVNVDQLTEVNEVANKGWYLSANGEDTDGFNIAPGEAADFVEGQNITITREDGSITVATADDVEFSNVEITENLTVEGDTFLNENLTVAGDTTINENLTVEGDTFLGDNFSIVNNEAFYDGPITENTHIVNKEYVDNGLNNPLTFMGDSGTEFDRKLGETTNVVGGAEGGLTEGNIGVVADGEDTLTIQLAENIDLGEDGSVKMGDTTVNNDGLTIVGGPSVTNTGIDAGGQTITNVAPGIDGTDAVNVDQLTDVSDVANKGWYLSANGEDTDGFNIAPGEAADFVEGQNITITREDGSITVATADDVEFSNVEITENLTVEGDTFLNENLTVAGDTTINENLTVEGDTFLGDNFSIVNNEAFYDGPITENTHIVNKEYVDNGLNNPLTFMGDSGTEFDRKLGETTNVVGGAEGGLTEGNIGVVADGEDTLTIQLAENIDLGEDGSVKMGDTTVNNDGLTIVGGPSVTNTGIDAGGQTITNVAPGIDGTDAVNVDQLTEVNEVANKGWYLSANGEDTDGFNIAPGEAADFVEGQNITITREDGSITVATADDVEFSNVEITENLTVEGDTFLNENLTVAGDTTINENLTVEGDTYLGDNFSVVNNEAFYDGPITENTHIVNKEYVDGGLNNPLTFGANEGDDSERRLGDRLDIVGEEDAEGDSNIITKLTDEETLELALNDDLKIGNSITVGDTFIDGDSVTTNNVTVNENLTVEGETRLGDNFFVNNEGNVTYDGDITEGNHITNKTYVDNSVNELGDTPLTFAGDSGTEFERRLGETTNVKGGAEGGLTEGNIGVVADGEDTLNIQLAENINLGEDGSLTINETLIDGDQITTNNITVNENLTVEGDTFLNENLTVAGNTTINENLTVEGDTYLGDNFSVVNNEAFYDGPITENTHIVNKEYVDGGLNNPLTFGANEGDDSERRLGDRLDIVGEEDAEGDSNIITKLTDEETLELALNDDLKIGNSITVGDTFIDGDSVTTNNVTVNENLTVEGETRLGDNFFVNNEGNVTYTGDITEGDHITNKTYVDNSVNELGDTPLTFAGDSGTEFERRLGETTNVKGGAEGGLTEGNIGVVADGEDTLNIQLAENIDLGEDGSLTINETLIDGDSITTNNIAVNENLTVQGETNLANTFQVTEGAINVAENTTVNMGDNQITNVAAGTEGDHAVNLDQLNELGNTPLTFGANEGDDTERRLGDRLDIVGEADEEGNSNIITKLTDDETLELALNDDLEIGNSITVGDTFIDGDSITTNNMTVNENLTVEGDTFLNENLYVDGSTTINENLTVEGETRLGDNFFVNNEGNVTYTGDITEGDHITNKTYVDNSVNELGDTPLNFAGDSGESFERRLGETTNVKGGAEGGLTEGNIGVVADGEDTLNIQLAENIDLGEDGSLTINETLIDGDQITTNNITVNENLTVEGDTFLNENLYVDGSTTINENLTVEGETRLGDNFFVNNEGNVTYTGDITEGDHITNKSYVDNSVNELGDTPLTFGANEGDDTERRLGDRLDIVGEADEEGNSNIITKLTDDETLELALNDDLEIGNSITVGDTFIDGDSITTNNMTVNENLTVEGDTFLNENLYVDGSTTINENLTVEGDTYLGDSFSIVNNEAFYDGPVTEENHITNKQYVDNTVNEVANTPLTFGANEGDDTERRLGDRLDIVGEADEEGNSNIITKLTDDETLELALNDDLEIGNSITVGDTFIDGDSITTNNMTVNENLTVEGDTFLNENLYVDGSTTINENLTVEGDTYLGDSFSIVNNEAFYDGPVTEENHITNKQYVDNTVNEVANTPLTFGANEGDDTERRLGDRLDIVGEADEEGNSNIITKLTDDETLELALNDDLEIGNSITVGDTFIDGDSITTNNMTVNENLTVAGETRLGDNFFVNNEGNVTYSGDITEGDHIVNKNYLDGSIGELADRPIYFEGNRGERIAKRLDETLTISGELARNADATGANLRVDSDSKQLNLVMAKNLTDLESISVGDTFISTEGIAIDNGPSLTQDGIDAGDTVITNVAPGEVSETSTDAINGSQLYKVQQDITNVIDGGDFDIRYVSTNDEGLEASDSFANGQGSTALGYEATADGDKSLALGYQAMAKHQGSVALGEGSVTDEAVGTSTIQIGDSTYSFAGANPQSTVSIGSVGNERTITNVAAGRITADSTDAINGSQLYAAMDFMNGLDSRLTIVEEGGTGGGTGGDIDGVVKYDRDGNGDINYGTVTLEGGEEGTKLTNVADGDISQDSSDAINGSQLHDTNQNVANNTSNIADNSQRITVNEGNIADNSQRISNNETNIADNSQRITTNENSITNINETLGQGLNFGADEGEVVNRQLGDTVAITGDENITTKTTGDGVQVTLNRDLDVDSVTTGNTTVNNEGVSIKDGPSMTVDGIDAGGNTITNVAPGVNETDAVNVGQMNELGNRFANEINNVHGRIDSVERNANAGSASAIAASTVPQAWMPGKSMIGVGAGTYGGESAVSVGVSRLSDNGRWVIQGKVTGDSQSNFGAGVGAGWHW
ncbi:YadA-like family protein [Vreelandella zhaodongensis]|uniref:YadA-like family protein n=2 Tax=Vreelandella zhaodongensis TaxID=1176240 RepID=UPI003EB9A98F